MQMYVNYYDRYEKIEGENPTIGILLCKQSDEALVDLTLPENANIYAKEYKLYLPDKKLLQKKLKEWLDEEQNWFRGESAIWWDSILPYCFISCDFCFLSVVPS